MLRVEGDEAVLPGPSSRLRLFALCMLAGTIVSVITAVAAVALLC